MAENHPKKSRGRFQDLTGKTFGRLKVIVEAGLAGNGHVLWECLCECGTTTHVRTGDLKSRNTKSCGCLRDDARIGDARAYKHGHYGTPEWDTWQGIRRRCRKPLGPGYNHYGAVGVVVCDGWHDSVEAFVTDMGPKPSRRHSIDRKDNAHGYTCGHCPDCFAHDWPANCRWATSKEQALNRRSTRLITFRGETLCMKDWARRIGVSIQVLSHRLAAGWPLEEALTASADMALNNRWRRAERDSHG